MRQSREVTAPSGATPCGILIPQGDDADDGDPALDVTTLPLPPEARGILRMIAEEIRKPPPGTTADPIALRRWLDRIGKRLDGLAAIRAGAVPAAPSVERQGLANPRATFREQDRPAGLVVETRRRPKPACLP